MSENEPIVSPDHTANSDPHEPTYPVAVGAHALRTSDQLAGDTQYEGMKASAADTLERLLNEPTVSVPDAARLLGVGRSTVYTAVKSGEVPSIRVGNRVRIPSRWVRQVLQLQADPGDNDTLEDASAARRIHKPPSSPTDGPSPPR
ncbi:helix-turn-helix domain-containing protein [Nocardia sp. NPDC050408]|uniref:helix-turn-helix domain-containing protein n=1 Tax=Nocardia sp. NPDC050408 TaxID=3364319 RepID=UPI0037B59E90